MRIIFICIISIFCFSCSQKHERQKQLKKMRHNIKSLALTIEGWCTKEKALALFDVTIKYKPIICVEIGVYGGNSLFPIAMGLKYLNQGIVYAIDSWSNDDSTQHLSYGGVNYEWWKDQDLNAIYKYFLMLLKTLELEHQTIILKKNSEQAAQELPPIDMLHIDGNMSEESVYFDLITYFPKVKQNGLIWLNNAKWTTSRKAFFFLMNNCSVVKSVDNGNCVLFKKDKISSSDS